MRFFVILCCCVAGIMSCNNSSNELRTDVEWNVKTLNGKPVEFIEADSKFSIIFTKEGKINGKASCNSYFGNYEVKNKSIKFSTMGSTKMMCQDSNKEFDFYQALENTDSFETDGKSLKLKNGNDILAEFIVVEK